MSYVISQFINGICLNDKEFVLDGPDGDIKKFDTEDEAKTFLIENGRCEEDLDEGSIMIDEMCNCGELKRPFMHYCGTTEEIEGCPKCDDVCEFCK